MQNQNILVKMHQDMLARFDRQDRTMADMRQYVGRPQVPENFEVPLQPQDVTALQHRHPPPRHTCVPPPTTKKIWASHVIWSPGENVEKSIIVARTKLIVLYLKMYGTENEIINI
jgi:hypothetical protein